MLKPGARGPGPTRPGGSSSRFTGPLIGLGILVLLAALIVSLRGAESGPRGSQPPARGAREGPSARAPADAPRAPRATPRVDPPVDPEGSARDPRGRASAEGPTVATPEPLPRDASDPALKSVLAARDDLSREATETLIDNLTSSDEIVVAEAARALVARQATEAIAPLVAIRLEEAAGSGLSVIDALGKLGGGAEGGEKSAAVDRLLQMLREEKRRQAVETPGNLLQIYEALGDTRDPRAAAALEAELLDPDVPRAPKVVIVKALVAIGLASSKDAIRTAHGEQSAQRDPDAFEEEIRQELVAALVTALAAL